MAQLRRRIGDWWYAGMKRAVLLGAVEDPRQTPDKNWHGEYLDKLNDDSFEEAKVGDVWIVRGGMEDEHRVFVHGDGHEDWPIIGYGLWCPNERCQHGVHLWTHASDCNARYGDVSTCKTGGLSCWRWSGSIEGGDLTAQPSLFANHESCGWHGFLTAGEMRSV